MARIERIDELGFLGDCRSAVMVDRGGSVVWWCPGRFDADAWFGSLLGSRGGIWTLAPVGPAVVERRYLPGTLILESTFSSESGVLRLTEALLFRRGARERDVGLDSPGALARVVECLEGVVTVGHVFEPRPLYGAVPIDLEFRQNQRVSGAHGGVEISLEGDHGLRPAGPGRAEGVLTLERGDARGLVCAVGHPPGFDREGRSAQALIDDTARAWRSWNDFRDVPGGPNGMVARAAIVLKGLTHAVTGALVASPTTSLPEIIGEDANWDYRYGWLRDSSLSVNALLGTSCSAEVRAYFEWMRHVAFDRGVDGETQAVFGIGGERELTEITLDHLEGYAGSIPVRVGNDAHAQRQLDVYGHVLDAASQVADEAPLDGRQLEFLEQLAGRAATNWQEPDHGLWERREEPRRYTSSALMCWVALTRALELEGCGSPPERDRWASAREQIASELWRLWDEERQVFPSWEGSLEVDASALLFVLTGFLAADDPLATALIARIEAELGAGGLLRRWSGARDGGFLLCSYWLVEALAITGQSVRAGDVLARLESYANDIGLLPEEVDPHSGEALGNMPLALSHAGYICARLAIDDARDASRVRVAAADGAA